MTSDATRNLDIAPIYSHAGISLYCGDCREVLSGLPDCSVQCAVTSPPYYGLRDYSTAAWEGGDAACDHMRAYETPRADRETTAGRNAFGGPSDAAKDAGGAMYREVCGKCGARRVDAQIGLEPTPDCGKRHLMRLRSDLTADQRAYVARRLLGVGHSDGE